jgi:AraC family L-rhamnose operon regulatory protein RhaS
MTMKQDFYDNMQKKDIAVTCNASITQFHPKYVAPLGVRRFSGNCRIEPCVDVNGLLYLHEGTVRIGDSGPRIVAPFLLPIDRAAHAEEKTEGWLAVYRPEAINQSFTNWPDLPAGIETDPYAKRDRELLESVLPAPDQDENRYLILTPEEDQFILRLFSNLTDLLENQEDIYWPCRSRSFFLEILLFLWQRPNPPALGVQRSKAQRVHEWLRVHYPERFSLADLSRQFSSNRTTLQEGFRREYGSSIMEVLGQIRVEAATALMRNTELSLSEISLRSGFGDYSNFYREFRRRKSMTPQQYRKRVATVRIY